MSELNAFTRAHQLVTDQKINVYTKRRQAFRIVFDFLDALTTKGFLISVGNPIKNVYVKHFLDTAPIPREEDIERIENSIKSDIVETKEIL